MTCGVGVAIGYVQFLKRDAGGRKAAPAGMEHITGSGKQFVGLLVDGLGQSESFRLLSFLEPNRNLDPRTGNAVSVRCCVSGLLFASLFSNC